ncbi:MAG TPA: PilZ domain-containing protein [Verrucomicrobiae bacterium]|nr:PilZ domain-containing protein [Verrucomicrobiae bacterium]
MAFSKVSPNRFPGDEIHAVDSRKSVRYILQAEASCSWLDQAGQEKACKGATRDVSQRGAYVLASDCPPRGAPVRMAISLPPLAGEARALRIEAEGIVLRIDRLRQGLLGFAISNQRLILCDL